MKKVVCPGTFDPITLGHENIIERGLKVFDCIIIAVSKNSNKSSLFSLENRVGMIREVFQGRKNIEVVTFGGLLVDLAKELGVFSILRGLRTVSDFEYEDQMANANRYMFKDLETIFMMTDRRFSHLSSSLIREIVELGGSVSGMVPPVVEQNLKQKV